MKPYSNDLRRRIVEAYDSGEYSLAEVAELFTVSLATVKNFVRRYRLTGSADALPHAGGRKAALNEKARSFIAGLVKQDNDLTLAQLCKRAKARHKKAVSVPTMGRLLQALDLPRKKSRSTTTVVDEHTELRAVCNDTAWLLLGACAANVTT